MTCKLAIVTGTSRGLGLAVAVELLARDWAVLGLARSAAPPQLADADRYGHLSLDLADVEAVVDTLGARLADGLLADRPRVGLVNNAGLLDIAPIHTLDLAATVRSFAVNAAAPAWLSGRVLAGTGPTTAVRIVDVSSGAATGPYPGWGTYCASKAALRMFGQVLDVELDEIPAVAERDVRVVSYAPGVVDTTMQTRIRSADEEDFPRRARFEALFADGDLVDASAPAREIAALLAADDLPRWSERRYGA